MFWIQKSKANISKCVVSMHGSTYLLTTSHPSSPITWFFQNPSIFIHILIPCICTRQWYLWPSLLKLWSILVRHITSPGHIMSTEHIEASTRCWEVANFDWRCDILQNNYEDSNTWHKHSWNMSGFQTHKSKSEGNNVYFSPRRYV